MHTIVYLDQNYLNNMAKARCGLIEAEEKTKFWQSLFDKLKAAVSALSSIFWDTLAPFYIEVSLLPLRSSCHPSRVYGFRNPFCVPLSLTVYTYVGY